MKKILLLSFALFTVSLVFGQITFEDDFESYAEGDLIGTKDDWSTWSGAPGGADDAPVSSEEAHSGVNSVKFVSFDANGGPADVILPMPYRISSGSLILKMWMYVVEGTAGYYNFQGGTAVGQTWAAEMYLDDNGSLRVVSGGVTRLTGNYEHNQWFEIEWRIDFDKNAWEAIVDGECLGIFSNDAGLNSVGSVDFYPTNSSATNNNSIYFIDDVSFIASTDGLAEIQLDAGLNTISLKSKSLTGQDLPIGGSLRNNGTSEITSFEVSFDGGGAMFNETFDGLNIAAGETYDFVTGQTFAVAEGSTDVSMSLVSVNGMADEKICNDVRSGSVEGVTPAQSKRVLAEEATGTWCQWCPRGEVFINAMVKDYPDYFVPIAVHQGDPMANGHIDYIRAAIPGFTGYPNMAFDRVTWFSFPTLDVMENRFFEEIDEAVTGALEIGAEWGSGRTLNVSGAVNFMADAANGMTMDIILIEDNVTGTDAGYNQSNAYAGGRNGPMGGYENLPSPVPASQMVYKHVSRGSMTAYTGTAIPDGYKTGERHVANFQVDVPAEYDDAELHMVCLLMNPDGSCNNVFEVSLQEGIDHGFEQATMVSNDDIANLNALSIYPNPAFNTTTIDLDLEESSNVRIQVVNQLGQIVTQRDYGQMSGHYTFPVDLGNMPSGMYDIQIFVNDNYITKRLSVSK